MKNNSYEHFEVASYEHLADDEKTIYNNASNYWLKMNPDDEEGAHLCACGAVIIYRSLLESMNFEDETEEEQTADQFVSSCLDVTAEGGTKYVAHYRRSRRGNSEQYSVIYAGKMLFTDDSEIANECARYGELGIPEKYINDRRFEWMLSNCPEDIVANCLRAGEGDLEPEDFSPLVCEECDRDDCDWHPDTLADEESSEDIGEMMFPDGGEDDGYDPDGRV